MKFVFKKVAAVQEQVTLAGAPANTFIRQMKRVHDIPLIRDFISLNHTVPPKPSSNEAVHHQIIRTVFTLCFDLHSSRMHSTKACCETLLFHLH